MEQQRISEMLGGIDDDLLMETMALDEGKKRRWTSTTFGKIAMVACLPLLCAAGIATGVFVDVVDIFAPLLGGMTHQTEIIQEIGRPIGASATDNGVTISVDAIIGMKIWQWWYIL